MVLIFLRDWRSALIVVMNIPFALLGAVILLWATGQTINIMTLGGLALAVGVLVDEATVEIENIHTQMLPGVSRARAVVEACQPDRHGASALHVLHSGGVRSFVLHGRREPAAVRAAVAGRRLLDDRVLPALEQSGPGVLDVADEGSASRRRAGRALRPPARLLRALSAASCCDSAGRWCSAIWPRPSDCSTCCCRAWEPRSSPTRTLRCCASGCALRPERASRRPSASSSARSDVIRREVGPDNVEITSDFVGVVPSSYPVNLIHLFTSGPQEAVIQVALKPDAPRGEALRERLRDEPAAANCPDAQVSFEAGDIVSQVMSFGSPTPIEVAVQGINLQDDYAYAQKVQAQLAKLPFLRDLQFAQELNYPTLDINIDRDRAGQFGLTMADVVALRRAGHVVLAIHAAELLARSELRQRLPDSGAVAAEPDAERRRDRRAPGDAKRPLGHAAHRRRDAETRNHARD